ncbi:hypothetical protein G3I60_04935 [Streptomyces sp. SID13666]|uniref:hypothetical protein n=1 Tax=Streptomyces sp. SID13666 TaxID=2706054 RepID=UPI0013C00B69|nr:hypothetical protein [Streptomyces sp. SID13666]NEA53514.1 hypothetical protein [Streptomyces sp. SID13666]
MSITPVALTTLEPLPPRPIGFVEGDQVTKAVSGRTWVRHGGVWRILSGAEPVTFSDTAVSRWLTHRRPGGQASVRFTPTFPPFSLPLPGVSFTTPDATALGLRDCSEMLPFLACSNESTFRSLRDMVPADRRNDPDVVSTLPLSLPIDTVSGGLTVLSDQNPDAEKSVSVADGRIYVRSTGEYGVTTHLYVQAATSLL